MDKRIEIIRGDTTELEIELTQTNGSAYDLTGCVVWTTMKRSHNDPDNRAIYQHVLVIDELGQEDESDGLELDGSASGGKLRETISPEESVDFQPGTYYGDVQVRTAAGAVYTPIREQKMVVLGDITRAIEVEA